MTPPGFEYPYTPAIHPLCTSCDPRAACPYHEGLADGIDEEREAVVAWLRQHQRGGDWMAEAIEKGEHRAS